MCSTIYKSPILYETWVLDKTLHVIPWSSHSMSENGDPLLHYISSLQDLALCHHYIFSPWWTTYWNIILLLWDNTLHDARLMPQEMIPIQHHSSLESTLALEVADSTFFVQGGDSLFPWKVKFKTVSELILFLLEEAESKIPPWRHPSLSSLPPSRLFVESLLLRPLGSWLTSSSKK